MELSTQWKAQSSLLRVFCETVRTSKALAALICLRHDPRALLSLTINPADYTSDMIDEFRYDYQIVSLLRKSIAVPGFDSETRRLEAMRTTVKAERQCADTNARIYGDTDMPHGVYDVLIRTTERIRRYLGDAPDVKAVIRLASYGPGVSSSCKHEVHVFEKISSRPEVTKPCLPYAIQLLAARPELVSFPLLRSEDGQDSMYVPFEIVNHNTWAAVPKSAKTDRAIAVEPHLNILLQKGCGALIRQHLRKGPYGLDLENQWAVNQKLAQKAYTLGLATVDFSSASDTISKGVVEMLMPPSWFALLDDLRSHKTLYDKWGRVNDKFSSMGNGFTFELETLIFHAIALECTHKSGRFLVSTFGDDVVLPASAVDLFTKVCTYCGFTINREKSFTSGAFYESCGTDYFYGVNVRPFFLKELQDDLSLLSCANGWRHAAVRSMCGLASDAMYLRAWQSFVNDWIRDPPIGPQSAGDGVLWALPGEISHGVVPTSSGDPIFRWKQDVLTVDKAEALLVKHHRKGNVYHKSYHSGRYSSILIAGWALARCTVVDDLATYAMRSLNYRDPPFLESTFAAWISARDRRTLVKSPCLLRQAADALPWMG